MLRLRCPLCLQGRVFRGSFAMHEYCPVCRVRFEREEGYFLGALYISYPLSVLILGLLILALWWLLPQVRVEYVIVLAVLPYLPLMPAVFRYSRVLWMHFDRCCNPAVREEQFGSAASSRVPVRR
jgi:uncharacterized protein (DUF983 family)